MDHSTDGVTLLAGFIQDILGEYQHMRKVCAPAFEMAKGHDKGNPEEWVPIVLYNDICAWIETNIGAMSIRQAGIAIGKRVFEQLRTHGRMESPTPLSMMEGLKWAASVMIRDPKGRGWEILDSTEYSITMRRTQTFNCQMQEGLLISLVEGTGAEGVDVAHVKCNARGDEYCDYKLSWL